MVEIYDVSVKYQRRIAPKDWEHIEVAVELNATIGQGEEAQSAAEALLSQAREQVHAALKGTIGKVTESVEAATDAPAGRNITDAPENREPEGEKAYEDMSRGEKRAYTIAQKKAAAAAETAEPKTEPTTVIDGDLDGIDEPTDAERAAVDPMAGAVDPTDSDNNPDVIGGEELKKYVEGHVRAAVTKQTMDGTEAINTAKRIITEVGDGAVTAMDIPANKRQAVYDAVTEAFAPAKERTTEDDISDL